VKSRGLRAGFERNVFVNCPFDGEYVSLLRPLLFTVLALGYQPRIATERSDSGENRIDKIVELIRESRYSIHDISRLVATEAGQFSRFNLPFELGIDRGAQLFGTTRQRTKKILILESEPYDYKRALSDLSGADIKHHKSDAPRLVREVRNWFVETVGVTAAKSPTVLWYQFTDFASEFYDRRKDDGYSEEDLNFMPVGEYMGAISEWLAKRTNDR
jgi:hypothetical protein